MPRFFQPTGVSQQPPAPPAPFHHVGVPPRNSNGSTDFRGEKVGGWEECLDVRLEVIVNGEELAYKPAYKGNILGLYNPLILTIDPNFQPDIQVGLPKPILKLNNLKVAFLF